MPARSRASQISGSTPSSLKVVVTCDFASMSRSVRPTPGKDLPRTCDRLRSARMGSGDWGRDGGATRVAPRNALKSDRKSVVYGKSVAVRVDLGGRLLLTQTIITHETRNAPAK